MLIIDGGYYCYDTNTNYIFRISEDIYNELTLLKSIGISHYQSDERVSDTKNMVSLLIERGFFKSNSVVNIVNPMNEYIKILTEGAINQLVLEISETCNFRCRYCHQHSNSSFENKTMSFDVAKKSVDLLYEKSKYEPALSITFYGGEPLVNFDIIKKTVEYANSRFELKKINYNITTNASLLDDDIIDFFIKNNFFVLISLDGNEKTQNYHRKYACDGQGTFDSVWHNVCNIRLKNLDYFRENVRFNAVILPGEKTDAVKKFFIDNAIPISSVDLTMADMASIDFDSIGLKPVYIDDNSDIYSSREYETIKNALKLKSSIGVNWHHNGPCLPGVRKLFISSDGCFYPCEKLDKSKGCVIGSLEYGFDYSKIKEIINIGLLNEKECGMCWAKRLCSVCVKQCLNEGNICAETKHAFCDLERKRVELLLKKYIKKEESSNE